MTKLNFKKSVTTSFQSRHHNYAFEKDHQRNVTVFSILGLSQSKFLATPVVQITLDISVSILVLNTY